MDADVGRTGPGGRRQLVLGGATTASALAHEFEDGGGVFDLAFDWADGRWQLVGCVD